jgi:HAD superfamily (subfamily IIIA) phosphatase, TIGR01668
MNKYIPNMYQKDIYNINYKLLKEKNIKCLLFDLDNTIVPGHVKKAEQKTKDLFMKLKKEGFRVFIFSNSPSHRLKPFKDFLEVEVNALSLKPLQFSFKKIINKTGLKKEEIAIIGDQLLTDIIGGNKAGIFTILIDPITVKDQFVTKFNRKKENKILDELKKEGLFLKGRYYE